MIGGLFSSFLFPGMLAVFALAPIIVLMYLLKLKRRPVEVPSTLLWRRSIQDLIANAPFQKLRNNLLLWLQLLILLLLTLALARPVMRMAGMGGETIVVMIDLSASMQTVEAGGRTRLEEAKELALEAVDAMSSAGNPLATWARRDEMMVVGFADSPVPLQPLTRDRGALRSAIRGAEALDTPVDLTDAGHLLREQTQIQREDMFEPNPDARVILISDGGMGPTLSALSDILNIDYATVGSAEDNVGFTGIDVRESFAGDFEYQVFAALYNSKEEPHEAFVELAIDGRAMDLKRAEVPAHGSAAVLFSVDESVSGLATLSLVNHRDSFALDDRIHANVAPRTDLRVLVVSAARSPFLENVLSVDPRVVVDITTPGNYSARTEADIVFFYRWSPGEEVPPGNYVYIDAYPGAWSGFRLEEGEVESPAVIDWSRVHPLTRYANFQRVLIGKARRMFAPAGGTALVQATDTDLIGYHETETHRVLAVSFDPAESFWPVDVSFPIFFGNLLDNWSRTGRGATRPAYATGSIIPIVPPREAARATVNTPDGRRLEFSLEGQTTLYLTDTRHAGIYEVTFDAGGRRLIPVNLMSERESDIRVQEELPLAGRTLVGTRGAVRTRQEIWPWLVLAGLFVLMLEWGIYCRRTFM